MVVMNRLLGGAFSLVLIASAGAAMAQAYGPPPAGYPPAYDPPLAGDAPRFHDDMPGPEAYRAPPPGPCVQACHRESYGYVTRGGEGYDASGYDAEGYDKYGFDHSGFTRDGYDLYGYDQYGRDRYGRMAPVRREARDDRREGEHYGYREERYAEVGGPAYAGDRYGPPRDYWDEPADGYYVPSFGGALQHYGDPRCNTCTVRYRDCGCTGAVMSSISVSPSFFYDYGGVGPIPDGGYYGGGGGMVVMGGGASAHSSASASAYAASRSSVSIRIGGGHGGHWGGHGGKGGCGSCGGGHH